MHKTYKQPVLIVGGLLLFALLVVINPFGLDPLAAKVLAIGALMVSWWIGDAAPMPIVALLPLILFPFLGIARIEEAAAPYANPVIFLFMGGFMIGLAIEKWNLHKRIALNIIKLTGTSGNRIIFGFIIATGFLSMWLSNTATTMMMFPIAMSVIKVMEENDDGIGNQGNLTVCLLLSIAYASNIGGIATIIGTPPNVAYAAFLEKHNGYSIQFSEWMLLCTPLSILLLLALYVVMVKVLYPSGIKDKESTKNLIVSELRKMGKLSIAEKRVLAIFLLTAFLWIIKDVLNRSQQSYKLDDSMIAVFGAFLLFVIPSGMHSEGKSGPLMLWSDTNKMAWGVLLLFGGGISLAAQLEKAGLIQALGNWVAGFAEGGFILLLLITLLSIFISEVMSNVAQVIVFAPVIAGIAEALNANPLQLGIAMTLGASCAGMLPMGTPPNAIVFGSGKLKLIHMTKTGFVMNLIAAVLISLFCWFILPMALSVVVPH
ncbi:MAG TPA: DASS family sodium-coupled anion symporter [Flavipsychrobacter sp.]|nr:DASS family sodium-coupled anion symporter [Flavipsychrobacter sp.]